MTCHPNQDSRRESGERNEKKKKKQIYRATDKQCSDSKICAGFLNFVFKKRKEHIRVKVPR